MEFLNSNILYIVPFLGLIGLIVMFIKSSWVSRQDPGDKKMTDLAGHISRGAMAFFGCGVEGSFYFFCDCSWIVGLVWNTN